MPLPTSLPSLESSLYKGLRSGQNASGETPVDGLAICGVGLRWPGGVRSLNGFREWLQKQHEAKYEGGSPSQNGKLEKNGHENGHYGPAPHGRGGGELPAFDAAFFSLSDEEALSWGPSQGMLLQTLYESLEDAGETGYAGEDDQVRCYLATGKLTGHSPRPQHGEPASLIFKALGISTTECSDDSEAIRQAYDAVKRGDCRGALVASLNSVREEEHAGDTLGNTISVIYIKDLEAAAEDVNPVHAKIENELPRTSPQTWTNGRTDILKKNGLGQYQQVGSGLTIDSIEDGVGRIARPLTLMTVVKALAYLKNDATGLAYFDWEGSLFNSQSHMPPLTLNS
jgi:hypothetical protein